MTLSGQIRKTGFALLQEHLFGTDRLGRDLSAASCMAVVFHGGRLPVHAALRWHWTLCRSYCRQLRRNSRRNGHEAYDIVLLSQLAFGLSLIALFEPGKRMVF